MLTNYRTKETSGLKIANFDDIAIYVKLCLGCMLQIPRSLLIFSENVEGNVESE